MTIIMVYIILLYRIGPLILGPAESDMRVLGLLFFKIDAEWLLQGYNTFAVFLVLN